MNSNARLNALEERGSATEPPPVAALPQLTPSTHADEALVPVVPATGRSTVWGIRPDAGAVPRRRYPVRMLALVTFSYAVDTVLLALFAAAGTVSPALPFVYGGLALAVCATFFVLLRSGFSARARDPNLTPVQMTAASAIQLGGMAYEPKLAFLFLNVLFIIFAFGTLRLTVRQSLIAVLIVCAATGSVLYATRTRLEIPHASAFETALVWLCYASTLARCMYVGLYGSALRVKLHMRNVELAASAAKIERLANYDELTDTLNRRMMWLLLEDQLTRSQTTHEVFCVALFDLDHFKSINDRFGHAVGDAVLQEFAATVRGSLRATDRIARHGGEEFLVFHLDSDRRGSGRARPRPQSGGGPRLARDPAGTARYGLRGHRSRSNGRVGHRSHPPSRCRAVRGEATRPEPSRARGLTRPRQWASRPSRAASSASARTPARRTSERLAN